MNRWVGILTAVVAILSVLVVSAYLNGVPYSDNTASILISSLGVLVTALIAWQIFSLIKVDELMKKLESAEKHVDSMEERILKHLYLENADISAIQIVSILKPAEVGEERHVIERRPAYGLSAQTIRNQLKIKETNYVDLCLQTMIDGLIFAESHNNWGQMFNAKVSTALDLMYESILRLSKPMTLEQKNILTRIHDSRISCSVHGALRQ